MTELDPFLRRVGAQFQHAEKRLDDARAEFQKNCQQIEDRHRRYHELTARLVRAIIYPRMERLRGFLPHAELAGPSRELGAHCQLHLPHTPRFPATVELDVGFAHDAQVEQVTCLYALDILPVFMQFDRSNQLSFPLDAVDESRLSTWVEDQLVQFVETYLRIEFVDQYQRENLTTDPVCGTRFSKLAATAELEYQGRTYYFVSLETRAAFLSQPSRYVNLRTTSG